MSSPSKGLALFIAVIFLFGGTACQAPAQPQGSAVKTPKTEMPALPVDPDAAEAVVRKMLMGEAIVLLKATGLKYTRAQFGVPTSFDEDNAQNGELAIEFQPCSDGQVQAMTSAIRANGWENSGVSHGINVRKGPLNLQWGKNVDGCHFQITTVNIPRYLPGIKDITSVPELAAFKAGP